MNLPMRCFTIGGVVAVLAAALIAGLTLTRGVAGPRQTAAGYVDEIVAMHALQADIGLLRAQRQKLTETAVTGPSIKSLVGTVLVDAARYSVREESTRVDSQLTLETIDVGLMAIPAAKLGELVEAVAQVAPPYRIARASLKATPGKTQSLDGSITFERVRAER